MILILLFIGISNTVNAEGPNYNETVAFIYEKTSYEKSGSYGTKQKIKITDCVMNIITKANSGEIYKQIIPLKELDYTRFKVNTDDNYAGHDINVAIYIKKNKNLMRQVFKKNGSYHSCKEQNSGCLDQYYWTRIHVVSPQEINAPKLVSALKHLSKLCGAKGELF